MPNYPKTCAIDIFTGLINSLIYVKGGIIGLITVPQGCLLLDNAESIVNDKEYFQQFTWNNQTRNNNNNRRG